MHEKFKVHVPENQTEKDGEYYEELARYFESGVGGNLDKLRAFPKYVPVAEMGRFLAKSKLFPQLMIDLLKIGEETGDVPGALQNIAETYENELSIQLRVMTNLIEPAMIIIMAIGVGALLFSVLSAMFAITSTISK